MSKKEKGELEKEEKATIDGLFGGLSESAKYIKETPPEERNLREGIKRFLQGAAISGGKSYVKESIKEFLKEHEGK